VLAVLLALAERFSLAGVAPFISGHTYYVAGTNRPSNHAFGRAVDIGTINRELVSPANGAARQAALALASLPEPLRPDEIGSPFAGLESLPGLFSMDAGDCARQHKISGTVRERVDPARKPLRLPIPLRLTPKA
jgi:hypothetical protein